ncbi:MAG: hypothetical protein HY742_03585 [Deltaproteobacteria bacterium]|nr:hypothetical protein [Deltaproteobacteria bacterium]
MGGIRSYQVAERIVVESLTDYVAFSRPFIRESDMINRLWKRKDITEKKP